MVAFAADSRADEGGDFDLIFPPVNDENFAKELVNLQQGERLRTLPGSFDDSHRFEGSLAFLDSGVLEESVRTELRRGAYLALTYNPAQVGSTSKDRTLALAPGDFEEDATAGDFNRAFGVGYSISFSQGNVASGHPARVMSRMTETDLLTKKTNASVSWSCPTSLRFKIVRPEDVGILIDDKRLVNCNRVIDPQVLSSGLAAVRRVLRAEDWFVDMANRCIIPKPGRVGACYGEDLDIEYGAESCEGNVACTHFFSLCVQLSSSD